MKKLFFGFALLLFAACATPAPSPVTPHAELPYYRFFRGTKLKSLREKEFLKQLSQTFIPTLPKLYSSDALSFYIPAIPPRGVGNPELAEIALIVYKSEEIYKKVRSTPEGVAYGDLHWTVFDKATSKSGATTLYTGKIEQDVPYDVLGKSVNWYEHYTTAFIGVKKKKYPTKDFHAWLEKHVADMVRVFGSTIRGYLFVAGPDFEIAYMNWESEAAMKAGFETAEGKKIAGEASKWMTNKMFEKLSPFTGKVARGRVYQMEIRK